MMRIGAWSLNMKAQFAIFSWQQDQFGWAGNKMAKPTKYFAPHEDSVKDFLF